MTMRVHQNDPRSVIPNSDWAFADCTTTPFPGVANPQKVCLKNGFDTNHIYELVYTAKDPIVMGLGLAAIRDVASFFHHAAKDDNGTANPLAGQVRHTLLNGMSHSGRLLRTYLDLPFNQDDGVRQGFGRRVPQFGAGGNAIHVACSQPWRLPGPTHSR